MKGDGTGTGREGLTAEAREGDAAPVCKFADGLPSTGTGRKEGGAAGAALP